MPVALLAVAGIAALIYGASKLSPEGKGELTPFGKKIFSVKD